MLKGKNTAELGTSFYITARKGGHGGRLWHETQRVIKRLYSSHSGDIIVGWHDIGIHVWFIRNYPIKQNWVPCLEVAFAHCFCGIWIDKTVTVTVGLHASTGAFYTGGKDTKVAVTAADACTTWSQVSNSEFIGLPVGSSVQPSVRNPMLHLWEVPGCYHAHL